MRNSGPPHDRQDVKALQLARRRSRSLPNRRKDIALRAAYETVIDDLTGTERLDDGLFDEDEDYGTVLPPNHPRTLAGLAMRTIKAMHEAQRNMDPISPEDIDKISMEL